MFKNELSFKVNKLTRKKLALSFMFLFLGLSLFYALYLNFWNPFFLQGQITGLYWLIPFASLFSVVLFIILDLYVLMIAFRLTKSWVRYVVIILTILCSCVFGYTGLNSSYSPRTHQDTVLVEGKVYHLEFYHDYGMGEGDIDTLQIFGCDVTGIFCKLSSIGVQAHYLDLATPYYLISDPKNKSISIKHNQKDIYTCYADNRKPSC